MPFRLFLSLLRFLAAGVFKTGFTQEEEQEAAGQTLEALKAAIKEVPDEEDVPAIGIAFMEEDGPVWVDALGKADIARDRDATPDSMFRIGLPARSAPIREYPRRLSHSRLPS